MSNPVERVIEPRPRDLGDFAVRRVLLVSFGLSAALHLAPTHRVITLL